MPGCIVSATTASFTSVEKRRRRATPVITSTFENVSDIGVCLGLSLGPPAIAGVRSKQGALHQWSKRPPKEGKHEAHFCTHPCRSYGPRATQYVTSAGAGCIRRYPR